MSSSWKTVALVIMILTISTTTMQAAERLIQVDGITGKVKIPTTADQDLIYGPNDRVRVEVVRANLITYGYRITLDKEEPLVIHHIIIGGPTVTDADSAADLLREDTVDELVAAVKVDEKLIDEYKRIAKELRAVNRRLAELQSTVSDTEAEISGTMCNPGDGWPSSLLATRAEVYCALTGKGKSTAGGSCVKGVSDLTVPATCAERALRSKLGDIEDALSALAAELAVTEHKDDDEGFASLESAINGLKTVLDKSRSAANGLQHVVDRWQEVILSHPDATISSTFLIADESKRYTVGVHRFDAANPPKEKKSEGTDTDTKENDASETIATIVYEGHGFSRLNFALGLAHAYRSHNDTFEIVKSVAVDKTVTAHVERKSHDTIETKPIASLGVYLFNRIDPLDMTRKPAMMLSVGVEVAEKPSYFAGVGYDWPSGLTVSVGITRYEKAQLSPGWAVGQQVPLKEDGTPVLSAPITNTSTALAPYVAVQFRPTIFRAFSKLFKPGD